MDVNGGHGRPHSYGSCKRQDLPSTHSGVLTGVTPDKVQDNCGFTGQSPGSEHFEDTSSQLMQFRTGSLRANMLVRQSEGSTTFNQAPPTNYKRVQACYSAPEPDTQTGDPIGLSPTFIGERVAAASAVSQDSHLTTTDSGQTSDSVSFSRSYPRFASTRHQSYGSLSVQAGVVGLSTNSATLAFMPLRASDEHSKTTIQSSLFPAISSSASTVGQTDPESPPSTSSCSFDLAANSYPKVSSAGISGTAAAIWDRRTIFFSEAPKPVSLGERPQTISSASASFLLNAEERLQPEAGGSTGLTGGQSGSNILASSSSDRLVSLGSTCVSEDLYKLSVSSDAKLGDRSPSGRRQQLSPPVSVVQTINASPTVPRGDAPKSLSVQSDSGFLSSRSKESPEVDFFSLSPPGGSPKDAWCRSSPQNQFSPSPLLHKDTAFWESGESGCHYLPSSESPAVFQHSPQYFDAFTQPMPPSLSPLVTPPKVGNIQKLKAFFGETTPRIMEAKSSDTRSVNESTDSSVEIESSVDIKRTTVMETISATKSATVTTASVLLDRSVVTAKGKKMANWVLASRHHSSHPQLQGTRPKKSLTDREPSLSPKQKEHRTWKGKVVRTFKRHSSSSAVVTSDAPSQSEEITGTFGVPLECCYPSIMNELVPLIVEVCTQVVAERGIDNQGIYRVPGNSVAINTLVEELNRDPESACLDNEKWQDVNSVSSLLKLFFRKLPDSLITDDLYEDVMTANRIENSERRMLKLKKLLHELPDHNFETFRFLAQHLNKVASREEHNKMDAHNLAIVFGPTLVRPQDNSMVVMVKDMADQCRVVETIIVHCDWFFSSWDEDVNVPVDELSGDATPISSMNQQLLAKAESLAAASFHRDFISSVVRAKPGKIKNHLNNCKSANHNPASSIGVSRLAACLSGGGLSPLQGVDNCGKMTFRVPAYRFEHSAGVTRSLAGNNNPYTLYSCQSLRLIHVGHSQLTDKPPCIGIGNSASPPSYQRCSSSYRVRN